MAAVKQAIRCLVAGRVQGVHYRAATRSRAAELAIDGSVRNLVDGRVEVIAEGAPEAVGALARWLWQGPPGAHVEQVRIEAWSETVARGFAIER
jgi:acylphosphatase